VDISINAKVSCSDGPCGQSTRLILKPTTEQVTDLVVVSDESLSETEYLVSIDHVAESTPDKIRLDCSKKELSQMPIFDRIDFVPSEMIGRIESPYLSRPFYPSKPSHVPLAKDQIPAGELVLRRGAAVEALDGHIGQVDEFLINPSNDHITHLVMREGHLWGQKDVTIPVAQIDHYKDNTVYLKMNKQDIEILPTIPIRHNWAKKN
jgi:hypothetical protein